jgi:hypothetical protein
MAIISISGYSGTGKDVVGKLIQYNMSRGSRIPIEELISDYKNHEWWLEEKSGWEIKKWAGKLKYIATVLTGIPTSKFEDQEFKKTNLGPEWGMTVRDLLQRLGTEAMRDGLHKNVWVNALMADYKIHPEHFNDIANGRETGDGYPNWIITDTRFPNEAQAIKDKGGMVIKVDRSGVGPVNGHPSEDALKDYNFDYVIHNDGSINDLDKKVIEFINNFIFTPN